MRKIGTWIVMTGFTLIAISTVARKSNTSLNSIVPKNGSMETEYKVKIRPEVEKAVKLTGKNIRKKLGIYDTVPKTTGKSTIPDHICTDARNKNVNL